MTSPRDPIIYDFLAFYLAIPLLFGVLAAPFALPPQGAMDLTVVAYVCFRAVIFWAIMDGSCRAIGYGLARHRLSKWAIFAVGFITTGTVIYLFVFLSLYTSRVKNPAIAKALGHDNMGWNIDYVFTVFGYMLPAWLLWCVAAYLYPRALNVELFRYAGKDEASDPATVDSEVADGQTDTAGNPLLRLVSGNATGAHNPVLAVNAEEHYIRVWTQDDSRLVRYRFRDAVNDLEGLDGLQVHRSWWVALSAIDQVHNRRRKMLLRLTCDDLEVPVSLSYKQVLLHTLGFREGQMNVQKGGRSSG